MSREITWTGWFNGGAAANLDPQIAAVGGVLGIVILDPGGALVWSSYVEGVGNGWGSWYSKGGVLNDVSLSTFGGITHYMGRATNNTLWWVSQVTHWSNIGSSSVVAGRLYGAPR